MGRLANQVKAQEWRKRLRRFDASDVTVARFCSRERAERVNDFETPAEQFYCCAVALVCGLAADSRVG